MAKKMITVNSAADIPDGMTEAEVHEFWKTHEVGEGLLLEGADDPDFPLPEGGAPAPDHRSRVRSVSTPISLRLGKDMERRLRALAERKGTPYQTLLKEFLLERIYEEEKRYGILGGEAEVSASPPKAMRAG